MDHMSFQMPGSGPPLMNQPPQIFGSYAQDGMPNMAHMPDMTAHMFSDAQLLMEDTNDAKRRRIARASLRHTDCAFTQVEKKRSPPKGAKYIEGLENRLGRMEQLLRLSGVLNDDDPDADLGALEKKLQEKSRQASVAIGSNSPPVSPLQADNATPQSSLASPGKETAEKRKSGLSAEDKRAKESDDEGHEEVEALSEMMCSLVTNQSGETRYIGSSSGFSIFSPKGIQWVNTRTGDDSFQEMISEVSVDDHKWTNWKPEVFRDLFQRPVFRPLPPKQEALSLLTDYFENFNCMFPLFHQPTFMHLVELQYSSNPYQGSGWWASLNCALAIAHRLRVMSNLVPQEEDEKAWAYLKNAMGVFSELTMRNTDLLSVQALLGMALFMQGTPNPQPSFLLIAAAIRLSHSIGLHKRGSGFNLNPIEIEQRKRVFWIAYMLDKDLCLRSGRPPAQDDDDMNVELPDADPDDNIGNIPLADGKGKMNLFRVMCEFAVIESSVYKRLYSTKATKQSDGELLNTIGELDQQLEDWKDRIPIEFRPEHEIKASHTPLILHVVMLHFAYYNCLTTIHRMSVHHGYWTSRLANYAIQGLNARPLNPRVFSSAALSTAAARASISLLKYVPQGDFACVWLILYFPVSALVTLFGNILQNPLDVRAKNDTRLMDLVVTFLSMLGQEAEQGGVHRMLGVCSEFVRIAKLVIDKAENDQTFRRKRRTDGKVKSSKNLDTSEVPIPTTIEELSPPVRTHRSSSWGPVAATSPSEDHKSPSNGNPNHDAQAQAHHQYQQQQQQQQQQQIPQNGDFDSFNAMNGFPGDPSAMSIDAPFHQPLLPQDLFALPMTLDWSWAEMSGGAYPSVENGNFGDPPSR
ncbi:fungal specific transcription factor domain-containing protein [Cordyceps fumosorosea ARSEF 2679]|uniref:Fungal specific transcription factor domain-containing protein n=1 Tax=Cordyceps fumosorosea (strain ARSEF 2679) TaxID=1081104 RepID=A0A167ZLM9_CORFA|nr:fungal specific transcription factor domain-containing protein [Cordyceps fumosorosea ARSEF 2679]OAA67664.1 fungal specific transcription factor domain-containing protein [Cordyceps fumosorosea ARSEF 2679]